MVNVMFKEIMDGLVIDRIVRDHPYSMPAKHFHKEFEIYYLLDGSRRYFIENESVNIGKGCLVLVDRFQPHKTEPGESPYHDRISIELEEEPFATFLLRVINISLSQFFSSYAGVTRLNAETQTSVEGLLFDIARETKEKLPFYETAVMLKLTELVLLVTRLKTAVFTPDNLIGETAAAAKVREVADCITENCGSEISLTALSKKFYMSKPYLSRIFKEVTGCTVHEYINICRIKSAKDMLANTNDPVAEIASALNYKSATYFGRIFRKFTETSPLQNRKKIHMAEKQARERRGEKNI